jgi:CRP-like cAMP-binding protein
MYSARMQAGLRNPGNALLGALPTAQGQRLIRLCGTRPLSVDQIIGSPSKPLTALIFPLSGVVAESLGTGDFGLVQLNVVGSEGMLGRLRPARRDTFELRSTVVVGGRALVIARRDLPEALLIAPRLDALVTAYGASRIGALSRAAICLGFHPAQPRLARWLFETAERCDGGPIEITHERLAVLLGMRRSGVTLCAGQLSAFGLIDYRRGVIRICDWQGLAAAACSCLVQRRSTAPPVLH